MPDHEKSAGAKPLVLFYVQHLLGIGHVFRATRVARGLAENGFEVHLAWGGTKVPDMDLSGFEVTFLEAVRTPDEDFSDLVFEDGTPVDATGKARRRDQLLNLFQELKPDVVMTEAYPFGRRLMRFELVPLMEAASLAPWKPLRVSSIRDIMQEDRAENRVRESLDMAERCYDLVMVHGDPDLIPIEATLQGAEEIADKIRYTGLVLPEPVEPMTADEWRELLGNQADAIKLPPDVLVSAGGGAVGKALMLATPDAMQHANSLSSNWVVTTGMHLDEETFQAVKAKAPPGMVVLRFIPGLARAIASVRVSVSRAGYNTVGDILTAGTAPVLVPFEGGRETEQFRRAQMLAERGYAIMLRDEGLTPEALGEAVRSAGERAGASLQQSNLRKKLNTDGPSNAARILHQELGRRVLW